MKRSRLHVVGVAFAFAMILWHASRALQFQHATLNRSEDISNITFAWNASYSASGTWLTPDPNAVKPKSNRTLGRIVYKYPVQLITSDNKSVPINRTASFNTSFSFQIITTGPYGTCGSGMAFFISTSEQPPENSGGKPLGLMSNYPTTQGVSDQFFAVEFDTYQTSEYGDPSASHIGIDINSLISSNITDTRCGSSFYPELHLYNNYTFTAWIEYNASSHLIQVWMTNSTASPQYRPLEPCLQLQYDLSSVFQDSMYVGFSGTNILDEGFNMEGFAIHSWNFSSDDLTPVVSPAPALLNSASNCSSCGENKSKLPLVLALPGVFITVAVCGVLVWFTVRRLRRKARSRPGNDSNSSNIELASSAMPRYSYRELRKATHGFDDKDKVGEGGFSSVYRGILADGSTVAVKKLKEGGLRRESDFSSEIRIISNIRHRNLLQLQGWCYEKGEALLVYKYMAKGSLDTYLFGRKKGSLQSETRSRILLGVAAALEYLHGGLGDCVLHRDVKAANVLLTEDFEPMLGDFGLARLISHNQAVTMTAAGTPGYVAPEVVYTGRATDKADVYSFGVLALEVACGRTAIDGSLQPQEMRLVNWVWLLHQSDKLMEALDPSIYEEAASMDMRALEVQQQWRCVLHVALMCCHSSPESRPTMRQVTQALQDTMLMPLPTTMPTYPRSPDNPIYRPNPDDVFASGSSTFTGLSPSVSRSSKTLGRSSSSALISEIYGSTMATSTVTNLGRPAASSAVTNLGRPAASSAAPSETELL